MSAVHVHVRIAGEHYSLPVERVLEVADLGQIAPVPGAPPEIVGVRNLRGQVVTVIDLARMLGLGEGESSRVVVAEVGERRAGLLVDAVLDIEELPPPSEQVDSEYVLGACLVAGELVGALDVDAILTPVGSR